MTAMPSPISPQTITFGTNPYYVVSEHLSARQRAQAVRAITRQLHNRTRMNRRKAKKWYGVFLRNGGTIFIKDEMHEYAPMVADSFVAAFAANRNANHAPVLVVQSTIPSAEETVAMCIVGQPGAGKSYTIGDLLPGS